MHKYIYKLLYKTVVMQSFELIMIFLMFYLIGQLLKCFRPMVCWSPAIERSEMRCHCYSWYLLKMMRNWQNTATEQKSGRRARSDGVIGTKANRELGQKHIEGTCTGCAVMSLLEACCLSRDIKDTLPPTDISKYTFSTPYVTLV